MSFKQKLKIFITINLLIISCVLVWICTLSYRDYGVWSINIYSGDSPFNLHPTSNKPVLVASDVTDIQSKFVADPFIIQEETGVWNMFFEVDSDQGDIAYASSDDGVTWKYEKIILNEDYHLSYPHVFLYKDNYFMIPESGEAHATFLYKATDFPTKWEKNIKLLDGDYEDPSIYIKNNVFYLFASQRGNLTLHYAFDLTGPWYEHPASPIVKNNYRIARQAGRIIEFDNKTYRFSQDGSQSYGRQVFALEILELSPTKYVEQESDDNPIFTPSGKGWNKDGMHQIDAHQTDHGWMAAVDGKNIIKKFDISYGYRQGKNALRNILMLNSK